MGIEERYDTRGEKGSEQGAERDRAAVGLQAQNHVKVDK